MVALWEEMRKDALAWAEVLVAVCANHGFRVHVVHVPCAQASLAYRDGGEKKALEAVSALRAPQEPRCTRRTLRWRTHASNHRKGHR